jgi:C1A family cysteine protease
MSLLHKRIILTIISILFDANRVKLPGNDYKALMNAVAKVGPVGLALAAGEWAYYEKGIFEHKDTVVNHAVTLVGYGVDQKTKEKYWRIRNSWGPNYGEKGKSTMF